VAIGYILGALTCFTSYEVQAGCIKGIIFQVLSVVMSLILDLLSGAFSWMIDLKSGG
jgi:hypothetical protein